MLSRCVLVGLDFLLVVVDCCWFWMFCLVCLNWLVCYLCVVVTVWFGRCGWLEGAVLLWDLVFLGLFCLLTLAWILKFIVVGLLVVLFGLLMPYSLLDL